MKMSLDNFDNELTWRSRRMPRAGSCGSTATEKTKLDLEAEMLASFNAVEGCVGRSRGLRHQKDQGQSARHKWEKKEDASC